MEFRPAPCHPDRKLLADGLCESCYAKRRYWAKKTGVPIKRLCKKCRQTPMPDGNRKYCAGCQLPPVKHCLICKQVLPRYSHKHCPDCRHEATLAKGRLHYLDISHPQRRIHHRRPQGPMVFIDREKFRPALERMLKNNGRTRDVAKLLGCPFGSAAYHVRQMYGMPLKKIRQLLQQEDKPVTLTEDWEQRLKDESLGMDRGKSGKLTYGHQFDYEGALGERARQRSGQT